MVSLRSPIQRCPPSVIVKVAHTSAAKGVLGKARNRIGAGKRIDLLDSRKCLLAAIGGAAKLIGVRVDVSVRKPEISRAIIIEVCESTGPT